MLFEPRFIFPHESTYFATCIDATYESFVIAIHISTPIEDYLVMDWVYRSYIMTLTRHETWADLFILDIVDLDIILYMYWLTIYHNILDCFAKIMTLDTLGVPRLA